MKNILIERIRRGIKQGELAKQVGITPQYLRLIEKGEVEPRRDLMMKISKVLNVSVIDLFFNENN